MKNRFKKAIILSICIGICFLSGLAVSSEDEGRDPFASQLPGARGAQRELSDMPRPQLSINGIVWQTSMPQAIVNNQVVKIGDEISQDIRIIGISKEGVTVEYEGKTFFYSSSALVPVKK